MINKTRNQLVAEEKIKLMKIAEKDGFYLFEIGQIFKMTKGRVSQIFKKVVNKSSK